MNGPYEYYNGKLGVKIKYLISDKDAAHEDSIRVIPMRTLNWRMKSPTRKEKQLRLPATNFPALIEFHSMPYEWQTQMENEFGKAPENMRQSYFSKHYKFDTAAYTFFSRFVVGAKRTALEPNEITEYTYNASVLNAVGEVLENRRALRKAMGGSLGNIWQVLSQEVNAFKEVAHTLPVSYDGLRKKFDKYKKSGYESLVSGRRGNDNARKVDENVIALFNALFAGQHYKPTATEVHRIYQSFLSGYTEVINRSTGEQYNPADFKTLSDSTVNFYLNEWESLAPTQTKRGGNRQLNIVKFKPHHETEAPTFAGSLLSVDDRQPPFWYEHGKRMWFYIGIDLASGMVTAYVYGKSKEGIILEFYRQLIRNYTEWGVALPDGLECESSLNSSFTDSFLQPGVMFQNVRIEANNARGKRIERYFGEFRNRRERSDEGWIGRPFAKAEANQIAPGKTKIIPYDTLVERRLQDIEDWNNEPHHKESGLTRFEYFLQNQHPDLQPTNWPVLLYHIGYHTPSSCKAGYVILKGRKRMIADNGAILTGDALIHKMKQIEGNEVDVYWLDGNDGSVMRAVAFLNGRYVCELMPIPRYNRSVLEQTDECKLNQAIQASYSNTVTAYINRQVKQIDQVLVINNEPKTLNRKFTISGLKKFVENTDQVEVIHQDDEELITLPPQTTQPNWKQRFSI